LLIKKEFISGIIITSAVLIASALVPVLGFVLCVFIPLTIVYFARTSRVQGVLVLMLSIIAATVALISMGINGNLPFMFIWGSVGIFLSEFLKKKYSLDKAVFYSVLAFLTMGLVFFLTYSLRVSEDPWVIMETQVKLGVAEAINAYAQAGLLTPDQVQQIRNQSAEIAKAAYHLLPAMMVIGSIFFIWLNAIAARVIFLWRKTAFPVSGDLAYWRIPDQLVWFVIASGSLILIPVENLKIAGLNLISIFLFIYFFQGLSIIHFFFQKKNMPNFLRGVFYILIFAQLILSLMVIGLGFFDLWLDFRKINQPIKLSEEKGET
jgi:uncharacterized protein YybS (DUF2232 family)